MCMTAGSRAVLIVTAGALAFTVGTAAAKTDRDTAMRHCMALARSGTPPAARPSLGSKRRQAETYNQCMEQAGFGRGHAKAQ